MRGGRSGVEINLTFVLSLCTHSFLCDFLPTCNAWLDVCVCVCECVSVRAACHVRACVCVCASDHLDQLTNKINLHDRYIKDLTAYSEQRPDILFRTNSRLFRNLFRTIKDQTLRKFIQNKYQTVYSEQRPGSLFRIKTRLFIQNKGKTVAVVLCKLLISSGWGQCRCYWNWCKHVRLHCLQRWSILELHMILYCL